MRNICFLLIFLSSIRSAFSQSEIGFQAGMTKNRFWGHEGYKKYHSSVTGFSLGGIFNKAVTDHLSISTGLFYERTGSGINDLMFVDALGNDYSKGDVVFDLNYLTIPMAANYRFGKTENFGLTGGFFAGYLVSAKYKIDYETNGNGLPEESKNTDNYRNFNYGVLASASYRLKISKNKLLAFSIEDYLGLNNIDELSIEKRKTHSLGFFTSFVVDLRGKK